MGTDAPTTSRVIVGILLAVVSAPFVIMILSGVVNGGIHSQVELAMLLGLCVLLVGVTLHFFIGSLVPWLLPAMFVLLGLGSLVMAILGRDGRVLLASLFFLSIAYRWITGEKHA